MSAATASSLPRERFRLADRITRRALRFERIEESPEWPLLLALPCKLFDAALRSGYDRLQWSLHGHACAYDWQYSRVTGKLRAPRQ
jgi:hypothetical protein